MSILACALAAAPAGAAPAPMPAPRPPAAPTARPDVPSDEVLGGARASRQEVTEWIKRGLALETYVRERISPTVKVTEAELKAYYEGPFRSEAKARGLEKLPPFTEVTEEVRELVRERKLNEEIERWTEALRTSTQILVYRR